MLPNPFLMLFQKPVDFSIRHVLRRPHQDRSIPVDLGGISCGCGGGAQFPLFLAFQNSSLKILLPLPVSGNRKVSDMDGKFLSEKGSSHSVWIFSVFFLSRRFFQSVLKTERICPAAERNRSFFSFIDPCRLRIFSIRPLPGFISYFCFFPASPLSPSFCPVFSVDPVSSGRQPADVVFRIFKSALSLSEKFLHSLPSL